MRTPKTKRLGPTINRGGSEQCVQTDPRFIAAVVERFGRLDFDLAANPWNAQAPLYFTPDDDSLAMDWSLLEGNLWLNCEFATAPIWASKCMRSMQRILEVGDAGRLTTRIMLLTPASVSTNWFADFVHGHAFVYPLRPRLTFVGHADPYPRDLMLSVYGRRAGFEPWQWM